MPQVRTYRILALLPAVLLVALLWGLSALWGSDRGQIPPPLATDAGAEAKSFRIMSAEDAWPKILEATIDPPDVHVGDTQRLAVVIDSSEPIASALAKIELDHEIKTVPLVLIQEGTYAAEWTVYDTHDATYRTTFVATDVKGRTNNVTLAWSDACGIPMSGDWTSQADCAISDDDGVELGNATLDSNDDLTLSANFAWNPGYGIAISNSSSIIINSGSSLRQTYIWARDDDGDTYAHDDIALKLQDADPGDDWYRRSTMTAIGDCDDTKADVHTNISGGTDYDSDGYILEPSAAIGCTGATQIRNGRTYYFKYFDAAQGYLWLGSGEALGYADASDTNGTIH